MKNYLPFENCMLTTGLSHDEVSKRLAKQVQPGRGISFSLICRRARKPYQGNISDSKFNISRIVTNRNSFIPVISGEIMDISGQVQIKIMMRPQISTLLFMSVWLGIVGLVSIVALGAALIPFIMFVFAYGMVMYVFRTESRESKDFLARILEARIVENSMTVKAHSHKINSRHKNNLQNPVEA